MENFQCSLGPPNIKSNCVVLFLSQLYIYIYIYYLFMPPNIFSKTTIVKARQNFLISPQEVKFIDVPSGCERNNVFMGLIMRMFLKQVFSVKLLLVADFMSAEDIPQ